MFSVDEPTAEAIRRAYDEGGELSGIVEFRRHFPLITDNAKAGECVRIIAGWKPVPDQPPRGARPHRARRAIEAEIEEAGEARIATAIVHATWLSITRLLATAGWSADELVQEVILSASDAATEGPA